VRPQVKGDFGEVRILQVAAQATHTAIAAFPAASSFVLKIMMNSFERGDQRVYQFNKIFFLFYRIIILIIHRPCMPRFGV
jgi:hypothetical protein